MPTGTGFMRVSIRIDLTRGDPFYDVTADGHFIMIQRDPLSTLSEFRVVLNWLDDLNAGPGCEKPGGGPVRYHSGYLCPPGSAAS